MSHRVTVVLAVALMVAGLFAWFDLRPREGEQSASVVQPAGSTAESPTPLLDFSPEAVVEVRIQHGAVKLETRRENGRWSGASRSALVDDFLKGLRELVAIMTLEASADDLREFGLEPPTVKIELRLHDASPVELFVGSPNPAGTATYARVGEAGSVVLTGALLRWELDKLTRAFTEPS